MSPRLRTRLDPRRDDRGQLVTGLAVVVILGLVMVMMRILIPIGQATDQKAGAQTAADAAALGAATELKDDIPQAILDAAGLLRSRSGLLHLLDAVSCGSGRSGAQTYAGGNGADVIDYCFVPSTGVVHVTVRSRSSSDKTGTHAETRALASVGVRLGNCRMTDDPTPTPSPTPTSSPSPTGPPPPPPPPPDSGTTLRCGDLILHFTIDGSTGIPSLDTSLNAFEAMLKPKLIG